MKSEIVRQFRMKCSRHEIIENDRHNFVAISRQNFESVTVFRIHVDFVDFWRPDENPVKFGIFQDFRKS